MVICKIISHAPVSEGERFHEATMDIPLESNTTTKYLHVEPSEFWIFDSVTGDIVAKTSPKGIVMGGPVFP